MAVGNSDPDMERDPRLAATYRSGAQEVPPAHLDAAIRAAARREVGTGPGRKGARFHQWAVPVSLAAVVVLSVSVVMLVREEGGDRWDAAAPPPVPAEQVAQAPSAGGVRDNSPLAVPPQEMMPRRSAALRNAEKPAVPPEPTPPARLQQRAAEAEQRATDAAAPSAKITAGDVARSEEAREEGHRDRVQSTPAAAQPLRRSAPSTSGETATGTAPTAKSTASVAAMADAPAQAALWQDLVQEPAEIWVRRIIELRRAGKRADADALATEFRRRFPTERLPDDLR